jgi:hypothetical protein
LGDKFAHRVVDQAIYQIVTGPGVGVVGCVNVSLQGGQQRRCLSWEQEAGDRYRALELTPGGMVAIGVFKGRRVGALPRAV